MSRANLFEGTKTYIGMHEVTDTKREKFVNSEKRKIRRKLSRESDKLARHMQRRHPKGASTCHICMAYRSKIMRLESDLDELDSY